MPLVLGSGIFLFFFLASYAQAIVLVPPRLELDGDPGAEISSEIKVTNETNEVKTYYTQVENFESRDESGSPSFTQTKEGLATWVTVEDRFELKPGEQKSVPFKINVPSNAEPGGYFASLFIRNTPPPTNLGEVSIGARLGSLILLRVNGDIQEGVDILEFGSKVKKYWFTNLPIEFYYRFQNIGTDRVKPTGEIEIKNMLGMNAKILNANRTEGSVLPRSIRRFESSWITGGGGQEDPALPTPTVNPTGFMDAAKFQFKNFAFGYYTANLNVHFGENNNSASSTYRFFVIPWQLLTLVIGGLIILTIVLRFIIKRYNRYIINQAKKA